MLGIRQLAGLIVDIGAKLSDKDRVIVGELMRCSADMIERQWGQEHHSIMVRAYPKPAAR